MYPIQNIFEKILVLNIGFIPNFYYLYCCKI